MFDLYRSSVDLLLNAAAEPPEEANRRAINPPGMRSSQPIGGQYVNDPFQQAKDSIKRLKKGTTASMTAGGGSAPGISTPRDAEWEAIKLQLGM